MDFDNYIENQRLKTDLQEKRVMYNCDECGGEIYEGNEFYNLEGYNLCEDCFDKTQLEEKEEHRLVAGEEYDE